MKKEELSKIGLEELKKKAKTYKLATVVLIILVTIMSLAVFLPNSKDISLAIKILPIAFLPLVFINLITYKKLSTELSARQKKL